jgi:hypothetical protein
MIISEKQIMQLLNNSHCLLDRFIRESAPIIHIEKIGKLLKEISEQQSDELKEVK